MPLTLTRRDLLAAPTSSPAQWRDAPLGGQFDVTDPADDSRIAQVPDSGAADARAAVDAAHAAFPAWRATPAKQRAQILKRWNDLIIAHQDDLGRLISREQGKPLAEGRARSPTPRATSSGSPRRRRAPTATSFRRRSPAAACSRIKEPVGVVAAITPWNFPGRDDRAQDRAGAGRRLHRRLQAGRGHAAHVAGAGARWPRRQACRPACSTSSPRRASARRKSSTSGSTTRACARSRSPARRRSASTWRARSADTLKKLSLELGGNAPFIVFDDADLDAAVEGLMAAKFRNGGQTCVCPNRVFVHGGVHDALRRQARGARRRAEGRARQPTRTSQIGPMINARAVEKIERHVEDAVARGATRGRRRRAPRAHAAGRTTSRRRC